MIIPHPLLGPRDANEFRYFGDVRLIERPVPEHSEHPESGEILQQFIEYVYLRDNPAGAHQELWYHEQGDRSWLVVTRDTTTHHISEVRLARDVAIEKGRG